MSNNIENIIPVKQLLMKILLVQCYMVLSHSVAQGSLFMPNENRNDLFQVVNSVFFRCDAIPELLNSRYQIILVGRRHDSKENVL